MNRELAGMKIGALLALLTLLMGFGLGAVFGLAEDRVKDGFFETAKQTLDGSATDLEQEARSLTGRAWTYMKRAHLHANGLGTSALATILLMTLLTAGDTLKKGTSLLLGVGALGYSTFWLLAAQRTPALGSTGAAKESLRWLAMPSSAFCVAGLLLVIWMLISTMRASD
jgi:hypothetical protein